MDSQTSGEKWTGRGAPSASPHTVDVGELMRDHNPHTPKTSMSEASRVALMYIQSDPVAWKLHTSVACPLQMLACQKDDKGQLGGQKWADPEGW